MQLKLFQNKVLESLSTFAKLLRDEQEVARSIAEILQGRRTKAPRAAIGMQAWEAAKSAGLLPSGSPAWVELTDPLKREVFSVCFKVPTGGGKTLLGAHAIGKLLDTFYECKTGLVVWVVPSEAILTQTMRAFLNPLHPYRVAMDAATGGRLKIVEKNDRFALDDVVNGLCLVVVMLQSTVREESAALRVFRDSGGFSSFFPPVDDQNANDILLAKIPNLDMVELKQKGIPGSSVRHSLANVFRVCRPLIIVDEGHRAYTDLARSSLLGLNPSFLLELTATPNMEVLKSNVLVAISGVEVKDEGLIKLPINITALLGGAWKSAIKTAMQVRAGLEATAIADAKMTGQRIRPIALVRVEATGKRKQGDQRVHADDVKEYLRTTLKVPDSWIRLKTATVNEISDEDLLADDCQVRVILTKDALREGWDCPFAYVLAILTATTGKTAITQMTGRVLRQPYARIATASVLNEAHIVCITSDVRDSIAAVSKGLQDEGLTDVVDFVKVSGVGSAAVNMITRENSLKGGFLLPVVSIKKGGDWTAFDPERDLLPRLNWGSVAVPDLSQFRPLLSTENAYARISVEDMGGKRAIMVTTTSGILPILARDEYVGAVEVLRGLIPNAWIAYDLILAAEASLIASGFDSLQIVPVRLQLSQFLVSQLTTVVDSLAKIEFHAMAKRGEIRFLASLKENVGLSMPQALNVRIPTADRPAVRADGKRFVKNAFAEVYESQLNPLELSVVRDLDERSDISWWWRLPVRDEWNLVGWRKARIYPDFIARVASGGDDYLAVLETKGAHLKGNDDTNYKKEVIDLLQTIYSAEEEAPSRRKKSQTQDFANKCRGAILAETSWRTDLAVALKPSMVPVDMSAVTRSPSGIAQRQVRPRVRKS